MRILVAFIALLFVGLQAQAEGIEFFHGTWAEALEQAAQEDKLIFVDAYAEWCGPCKRMAKTTFKDASVGEFFNANFINLKMDMEKGEGLTFRQNYPVSAFPTLYFIDAKGEVVHKIKGAQKVEGILDLGKFVLSKYDKSGDFAEEYDKGSRDPELVYNYVKALNKAGKPSLKIANDYIKSQKDLNTEDNLRFIHEAAIEADSRIFNLMIEKQANIKKLVGEEAFLAKVECACKNTANKAVEFESSDLHKEAKEKMKKYCSEKAETFGFDTDMGFYSATGDSKNYMKVVNAYAKKVVKNDANQLNALAHSISENFVKDPKAMKTAEKFAQKAAENGGLYKYYLTYASILNENGKKSDALKAAKKALELAGETRDAAQIKAYIEKLQS